jgi:beta-phosphoglucomutase
MAGPLAVIFDIDGVLVDSYAAHFASWRALAAEAGFPSVSEARFAATFGRTSREIIAELWPEERLTELRIAELDDRKEAIYRRALQQRFPAMQGAVELIQELDAAGFALAAGSSGPPANVELALDQLGQRQRFRAVVTGRDVQRGKPDPQVFQLCAQRLDASCRQCAVIEDAPAGIDAANAAGMLSIGLVSTGHAREELAAAAHVVQRLSDLSSSKLRQWLQNHAACSAE